MSKVGGAIPAWYWPEGVPRRSPVPNQTLDRSIKRGSSRNKDGPAIVWPDRTITYGELLELIVESGQAIATLADGADTVAIAESDPGEALVLMLGALSTGKRTFICDVSQTPATLTRQLAETGAKLVLTSGEHGLAEQLGDFQVVARSELSEYQSAPGASRPTKTPPATVIIAGDGELVVHTQYSLTAMAVSLSAFVSTLRDMALVAPPPLWNWESLAAITTALITSAPIYISDLEQLKPSVAADLSTAYAVMLRSEADAIVAAKRAPAGIGELAHLFVSTGYFDSNWRRDLESLCGREVLPMWGTAPLGPAVAAHPSWFPFEGHGIPLVNVRVVPIDPASGTVSVVPWEMLERAEIGVESPAMMTSFVRDGADSDLRSGKILRTFVDASVDHVGVVLMHKPRAQNGGPQA